MTAPDCIWAAENAYGDRHWSPSPPDRTQPTPYVRRDPAVLAELPETKAMIAAAERDAAREALMNTGIALHVAKREAQAALADVARLRETLKHYEETFCEGFCGDFPNAGTYHPDMDDMCSGCKARAALSAFQEAGKVTLHDEAMA